MNCCIDDCFERLKNPKVKHYAFPKNKDHADIWVDTILANTAQKSVNRSAVCAKHFLSTDFVNGHRKSTAVPSIFDPIPAKMGKPNPVSSAKRSEDNGVILNVLIKNNPAPNEESENEIHFTVETMGDNQISSSSIEAEKSSRTSQASLLSKHNKPSRVSISENVRKLSSISNETDNLLLLPTPEINYTAFPSPSSEVEERCSSSKDAAIEKLRDKLEQKNLIIKQLRRQIIYWKTRAESKETQQAKTNQKDATLKRKILVKLKPKKSIDE